MGDYLKLSVEEIIDGFILRIDGENPRFYKLSEVGEMITKVIEKLGKTGEPSS